MKLLGAYIHVKPLPKKPVSNGGIHLLEDFNDDEKQHQVLAVGQGWKTRKGVLVPLDIKPGDKVLLRNVRGNEMLLEDGSKIVHASEAIMVW